MNKGLKRLGIGVAVIGGLMCLFGAFKCMYVGISSGHWAEMVMAVIFCVIGGVVCYAGGEISALGKKKE